MTNFGICTTTTKKLQIMKLLLLLMPILMLYVSSEIDAAPLAPALYVFGDSLVDAGNNNFLPTLAKADFLPYGMNFDGGPTGRFTNGRTVADFIAEYLGLPYSPPYLSLLRKVIQQDQLTGLNYASAAAGILPQTGSHLGKSLNLEEQIGYFGKTVEEELAGKFDNSKELSDYLSKSLFLISIGSNDYINNYLATRQYDTSKLYSPQSYASLLIHNLSQHLQRLYELGARRVIVFEVGAIGCIPATVRQMKHNGSCVEEVNQMAVMFNDHLRPLLSNLTSELQGSSFVQGRAHWIGHDAFVNPSNYGLSDASNPCCLTWLNGTSGCIPEPWAVACQHPEKHYFFDGYHLTETLYQTIATLCFNGSSLCVPKNIQQMLSQH